MSAAAWLLVVVLELGWGGTDVKFQTFPDDHSCALARRHLVAEIKKSGGAHASSVFCLDHATGNRLSDDSFTLSR